MHVTAFPPHAFESMVERLNAIVEQVYKGNVEMLRAAVDECHRQSRHDLRVQRGAYVTEEEQAGRRTSKKEEKDEERRLKKEKKDEEKRTKKEKKEQLVKEARENTMSPTVQEMSSWDKNVYIIPNNIKI